MLQEFLNFDRYLTPSLIRYFYLLQVALIVIFGLSGVFASFGFMSYSFIGGLLWLFATLVGTAVGIIAARILTELILVLFQNNEHLAAIRARAEGH
jgi:hypothetical protein